MLNKIFSDKISVTKTALFFLCELQLIAVLLLICNSYNSFQNMNNRKATHRFAPRTLIFNLKQEV